MRRLRPAESRVWQALLNLPNPVTVAQLCGTINVDPRREARVLWRIVMAMQAKGYPIRKGAEGYTVSGICSNCEREAPEGDLRCEPCDRMWRVGYANGYRAQPRNPEPLTRAQIQKAYRDRKAASSPQGAVSAVFDGVVELEPPGAERPQAGSPAPRQPGRRRIARGGPHRTP